MATAPPPLFGLCQLLREQDLGRWPARRGWRHRSGRAAETHHQLGPAGEAQLVA